MTFQHQEHSITCLYFASSKHLWNIFSTMSSNLVSIVMSLPSSHNLIRCVMYWSIARAENVTDFKLEFEFCDNLKIEPENITKFEIL